MKNIYHIDKKITKNDEITDRTWISIEEPTAEDKKFLLEDLKIPAAFYNDIEDIDESLRAFKKFYNETIVFYNKLIRKFPYNIIGKILKYKE